MFEILFIFHFVLLHFCVFVCALFTFRLFFFWKIAQNKKILFISFVVFWQITFWHNSFSLIPKPEFLFVFFPCFFGFTILNESIHICVCLFYDSQCLNVFVCVCVCDIFVFKMCFLKSFFFLSRNNPMTTICVCFYFIIAIIIDVCVFY